MIRIKIRQNYRYKTNRTESGWIKIGDIDPSFGEAKFVGLGVAARKLFPELGLSKDRDDQYLIVYHHEEARWDFNTLFTVFDHYKKYDKWTAEDELNPEEKL